MNWLLNSRYAEYKWKHLQKDLIAGLIVGIIAIPLGMAFAIASGVKPEYGIYTTIIAGILISLFGGSRYQIGGPTGAFIPILLAIVMHYGYENLLLAGMMAGIMLVVMGLLRFGSLIKFIPMPVTVGFTSGIAVIIFTGQIANFLGLTGVVKHEYFIDNMLEIIEHIGTLNVYSLLTGAVSLLVIMLTPKLAPKVPGPLIGLIVSTIFAVVLFPDKVATIGSTFGAIPQTLPEFQIPSITWDRMRMLVQPALVIALLGGIESLLSAVVADGLTNTRHDSNRELVGQGIANIISPMFGGIPATGAIARTATNIKSGAVSPISGVIHGIVVLLVLLVFAPYASLVPLSGLAPILMVVAWNMSERKGFLNVLRAKSGDSLVLLVTFLLTVFTDLPTAVEAGVVLAVLLFAKRMSDMYTIAKALPDFSHRNDKIVPSAVSDTHDCPQINIFNIEGPLFFGAAHKFEYTIKNMLHYNPHILILRLGKVPFLDATGEHYLGSIVRHFKTNGGIVLISGLRPQTKEVMVKSGLYDMLGSENFFEHTGPALTSALALLDTNKCLGCKHYAFRECHALSRSGAVRVEGTIPVLVPASKQ